MPEAHLNRRYRVVHTTTYDFERPVSDCRAVARLTPRHCRPARGDFHQLITRPLADTLDWRRDRFGNTEAHLHLVGPCRRITVSAVSVVASDRAPVPRPSPTRATWQLAVERMREKRQTDDPLFYPFLGQTALTLSSPDICAYVQASFPSDSTIADGALDLMHRIFRDFDFIAHAHGETTTAEQVMRSGHGVCQDFAHLAVSGLRSLGIPARYVSGYMDTAAFRGKAHRLASDASHAWFAVFDPATGWIGFDPANDKLVDDHYITLAWGRDYGDAGPLTGRLDTRSRHRLTVSVDVAPEAG